MYFRLAKNTVDLLFVKYLNSVAEDQPNLNFIGILLFILNFYKSYFSDCQFIVRLQKNKNSNSY